jgi:hypothetical protein
MLPVGQGNRSTDKRHDDLLWFPVSRDQAIDNTTWAMEERRRANHVEQAHPLTPASFQLKFRTGSNSSSLYMSMRGKRKCSRSYADLSSTVPLGEVALVLGFGQTTMGDESSPSVGCTQPITYACRTSHDFKAFLKEGSTSLDLV